MYQNNTNDQNTVPNQSTDVVTTANTSVIAPVYVQPEVSQTVSYQTPNLPQTQNPELDSYVTQIEKELLDSIIEKLKEKKITVEESQQLARDFLAILPPRDKVDLLERLHKLAKKHPEEVLDVYVKYESIELEKERDENLSKLAELIHGGNIDEALRIAKEVNHHE